MNDDTRSRERIATIALLIATLFWGCGFTWAKTAGEVVNQLQGLGHGALLGPIWVLAIRFLLAGVLWFICFPDSRRGWDRSILWRTIVLGTLLSSGMIVQHIGLDRTSEAVSAFLTSLTILFVPLMMTIGLRKPPPAIVWLGVGVAGAGVYLMTGAHAGTFGAGELLGLACAVSYAVDIIAVNLLVRPGDASKVTGGQFIVVAIITIAITAFLPGGVSALSPPQIVQLMSHPQVGVHVALMAVFVSMGAFGLQFRFQPHIDPTRAALLYLMEPIFASIYAWLAAGRGLTPSQMLGAALILAANLLVEMLQARKKNALAPGPIATPIVD